MLNPQDILWLDAKALSDTGSLGYVATHIADGLISGSHRSAQQGVSIEFAQHRLYTPGDDPRTIDWRAYAKADRLYVKRFEVQTNRSVTLVLDASGSMGYGESTVSKFDYGRLLTACLARTLLRQRDAVGLALAGGQGGGSPTSGGLRLPPRSQLGQFGRVLHQLDAATPQGEAGLAATLSVLARQSRRRGGFVVITDGFDETGPLLDALRALTMRGHDVMLLHVMAPEELTLPFDRGSRFESMEVPGHHRNLDPRAVRKGYRAAVERFLELLRRGCGEAGCRYAPMTTDQPPGAALRYQLAATAASAARGGRAS